MSNAPDDALDPEEAAEMDYPTAEEINQLSDKFRTYIHDLETRCDRAGDLRRLKTAEQKLREYESLVEQQREKIEELKGWCERFRGELISIENGLSFFLRPDVRRRPRKEEIIKFVSSAQDALSQAEATNE